MPNIRDIFNLGDDTAEPGIEFDVDAFLAEADSIIGKHNSQVERPQIGDSPDEPPQPAVASDPTPEPVEPPAPTPEPEPQPAAVAAAPESVRDPLSEIPAERRAALLALDEAMTKDPAKAAQVFQTLSSTPQQQVRQPEPEPQMPEDLSPTEEMLWRQNQEMLRELREVRQSVRGQAMRSEQDRATAAASSAGNAFLSRYSDKLTQQDLEEIAHFAANTGVAARFANGADDLVSAFDQALEHVAWTNPVFRAKLIDAPTMVPTPVADTNESIERKRTLHALSGAASPLSSAAPKRPPLESREDGRLTPTSRMDLVKELAGGLVRQRMAGE